MRPARILLALAPPSLAGCMSLPVVKHVLAMALCLALSAATAGCSGGAADRRFSGAYGGLGGATGR